MWRWGEGALALLIVLAGTGEASACTCPGDAPSAELVAATAFAGADAVFEARVLEVGSDEAGLVVRMEVVQHWKGIDAERAVVRTAASGCGVPFQPDTSWLIYARTAGDGWSTDFCAGTRRIEDAADALASLGAGVVPVDITDEDEVEEPAGRTSPQRAGCASCTIGSSVGLSRSGAALLALVALAMWRRRR